MLYQNLRKLSKAVSNKRLHVQDHPTLPLEIYNYTPEVQYDNDWDETTTTCRGLVIDANAAVIVNCPPKFFNLGTPHAAHIPLDDPNTKILEKLDGYYISITKSSKYGMIVTSRGSFNSKYVDAAKNFLTTEIIESLEPDVSYFCELCQNFRGDEHIIVTRHATPRLVCWAARDQDGNELADESLLEKIHELSLEEMHDYLDQEVEGVVLYNNGERVKVKTDWYIRRHAIISNATPKAVWEICLNGELVTDYDFPDEIIGQLMEWQKDLLLKNAQIWDKINQLLADTRELSDKELGLLEGVNSFIKGQVFNVRKGKIDKAKEQVWRAIKP